MKPANGGVPLLTPDRWRKCVKIPDMTQVSPGWFTSSLPDHRIAEFLSPSQDHGMTEGFNSPDSHLAETRGPPRSRLTFTQYALKQPQHFLVTGFAAAFALQTGAFPARISNR